MVSALRESAPAPARARPGRILAIDYGRRRIGLALSDELGLTGRPLATLERTNRRADLRRLRELVREHGVVRIVVGHPVRLDGAAGPMAEAAAKFAARLERELGLPVEMVDERLSSWEASEVLRAAGSAAGRGRRAARKAKMDPVAAAVILRDYLERRRAEA